MSRRRKYRVSASGKLKAAQIVANWHARDRRLRAEINSWAAIVNRRAASRAREEANDAHQAA
jgi:hypothetical protein